MGLIADTFTIDMPGIVNGLLGDVAEAFRQNFYLELMDTQTGVVNSHVFVLNPRRYNLSEPFQLTLTPNEADGVIDEVNGIIVREIQLEGTFGIKKRGPRLNGASYDPVGALTGGIGGSLGKAALGAIGLGGDEGSSEAQPKDGSGNQHFFHLRNFFRQYSNLKKDPATSARTSMIFHALESQEHFTVVPRSFETPRDAGMNPHHYEYRITLAAIGPPIPSPRKEDEGGFGFTNALNTVNEAVTDLKAYVDDINETKALLKRKVQNLDVIVRNVQSLITASERAISSDFGGGDRTGTGVGFIDIPINTVKDLGDTLGLTSDQLGASVVASGQGSRTQPIYESATRTLRQMEAAVNSMLMHPDKFGKPPETRAAAQYLGERRVTREDLVEGTGGASATGTTSTTSALNTLARISQGSASRSGATFGSYSGLLQIRVDATTTLDTLANQFQVPRELIVIVNDLRAPYFTQGGGLGTLKPGDTALIPITGAAQGANASPSAGYLTTDETIYGVDLALVADRGTLDMRVDLAHGALDAELARGVKNVVQGVTIILFTERNTTQFLPDIGISRLAGNRGTPEAVVLATVRIREGLLSDPRITGLRSMSVVLDGDVLQIETEPRVRGSAQGVRVTIPFGSAGS